MDHNDTHKYMNNDVAKCSEVAINHEGVQEEHKMEIQQAHKVLPRYVIAQSEVELSTNITKALQSLELSFSPAVVREDGIAKLLLDSVPDMIATIRSVLIEGCTLPDHKEIRDVISLDTSPFQYARRAGYRVHELNKDDERRMCLQALFLQLLRHFVPLKYHEMDSFLIAYPGFADKALLEIERLRVTANWMDLVFYTLNPKNNKTFLIGIIPRLCEGRSAKYITGSGETKATGDRVFIYRQEGDCSKVQRPPRKRMKGTENGNNTSSAAASKKNNNAGTNSLLNSASGFNEFYKERIGTPRGGGGGGGGTRNSSSLYDSSIMEVLDPFSKLDSNTLAMYTQAQMQMIANAQMQLLFKSNVSPGPGPGPGSPINSSGRGVNHNHGNRSMDGLKQLDSLSFGAAPRLTNEKRYSFESKESISGMTSENMKLFGGGSGNNSDSNSGGSSSSGSGRTTASSGNASGGSDNGTVSDRDDEVLLGTTRSSSDLYGGGANASSRRSPKRNLESYSHSRSKSNSTDSSGGSGDDVHGSSEDCNFGLNLLGNVVEGLLSIPESKYSTQISPSSPSKSKRRTRK